MAKTKRSDVLASETSKPAKVAVPATVGDSVRTEVFRGGNGNANENAEFDRIKTLLHDRNSERQAIFAARQEIRAAQNALADAKSTVKERKEELDNCEAYLQGLIDAQESGQKTLPLDVNPEGNGKATAKGSSSTPEAKKPEKTEAAAPKEPEKEPVSTPAEPSRPWRDENPIDKLKIAVGRLEKLKAARIDKIWELEETIAAGNLDKVKGLGDAGRDKIADALFVYRSMNPAPVEPAISENDVAALQEKLAADMEAASDGVEFAEADPDLPEEGADVEDLTGVDQSVADGLDDAQGDAGDDVELLDDPDDVETVPIASEGKPDVKGDVDVNEVADALANVFCYVPGEVIEGFTPKIRRQAYDWAVDLSSAAEGDPGELGPYPKPIERFLHKNAIADVVAYVRKKRGY